MQLETISKPEHGSEEWLRLRWRDPEGRCVFGASEAASLMDASPYVSRGDLFVNKISAPQISPMTEAFRRGHVLEPVLLQEAQRILGIEIGTPDLMYRSGRWIATLDGIGGSESKPDVIVEAKTTTKYAVRDAEDLPQEWLWQTWVQSAICQAPVYVMCLDRDQRLSLIEVPSNPAAWDALQEEAEAFGSAIDDGRMLPAQEFDYEQIADLWKPEPKIVQLPEEARSWIAVLADARDLKQSAETQEKQAKDALARMMLDAEIGMIGDQQVLTWKQQQGRASLDEARLRAEQPDLCAAYEKPARPFRVMRISSGKTNKKGSK